MDEEGFPEDLPPRVITTANLSDGESPGVDGIRLRTSGVLVRAKTMGASYFYVNYDKGQFYHCGLLGWSSRFSAIGSGPGARALAILLSERGTWKRDRVSVIAETAKEFDEIFLNSVDVEVEVELMLIDVDGLEWIEAELERSTIAFEKMCAFALLLRRSDIINMLDKKFGVGKWQRRYESYLKANTDIWLQRIVEAQNRGLRLLA